MRTTIVDSGAPQSTSRFSRSDTPPRCEVVVAAVTAHGWRVSDRRLPLGDPFRVLAFVERHDDRFEVMQLGAGFEWHEFLSMEAAVAHVVETAPRLARERFAIETARL